MLLSYIKLVLKLILISILFGCNTNKTNYITIKGDILNSQDSQVKLLLKKNIRGIKDYELIERINENGEFFYNIELSEFTFAELIIDKKKVFLFLETEDKVFMSVDLQDFENTLNFKGKSALKNNYINQSYLLFESREHLVGNRIKTQTVTSPFQFKAYRDSIRKEHLNFLEINKTGLSEKAHKFARAQIDCRWGNKLFDYPTIHLFLNEQALTPDFEANYHKFAEEISLFDTLLLSYKKYTVYLDNYLDHQLKLKYTYKELSYNHDNTYDYYYKYPDLYHLAEQFLTGKIREAMQSYYLVTAIQRGRIETVKDEIELFKSISKNKNYLDALDLVSKKFSVVANGKIAPNLILTTLDNQKVELHDYLGKTIYVDFWASWCAPCINLIEPAKKLKIAFKDKDVVFLNVSVDTDENAWRQTVNKRSITGINLIANNKESNIETYGINAFPRYFIINKKGVIVDNDAKNPSQKEIYKDLDTLIFAD